jgi:hypothetical protein
MNENILLEYSFEKMSESRYLMRRMMGIANYFSIVLKKECDKFYLSDYGASDKLSIEIKDIEHLKALVFALCQIELKPRNQS